MPRTPLCSIESERSVLGAILLNPNEAFGEAVSILGECGTMFHDPNHGSVYEGMCRVVRSGKPLDPTILAEQLRQTGQLDAVGGVSGLTALLDAVPTSSNVAHYAQIVRRNYHLRRFTHVCQEGVEAAKEPNADPYALVEKWERRVFPISRERASGSPFQLSTLAVSVTEDIRRELNQGVPPGLATGFRGIDVLLCGMKPGEVIILAARPSVGKTALALNMAHHVGLELARNVMIVSLEMSAKAIVRRLLCIDSRVSGEELRPGSPSAGSALVRLENAKRRLREADIAIDDDRDSTSSRVRARVRHHSVKRPVDLVIVDYCQELHADGTWTSNRTEEIGQICRDIRAMAQEVSAPVLLLSQLNREAADGVPQLHHLRSSGDLEQCADVVLILHRAKRHPDRVRVTVAKNRNGPTGECSLIFDRGTGRFHDCHEREEPGGGLDPADCQREDPIAASLGL